MDKKNKINITVFGQQYMITGYESVEHLEQVASNLSEVLEQIRQQFSNLDAQRVSILTAANVIHEKLLLQKQVELLNAELIQLRGGE